MVQVDVSDVTVQVWCHQCAGCLPPIPVQRLPSEELLHGFAPPRDSTLYALASSSVSFYSGSGAGLCRSATMRIAPRLERENIMTTKVHVTVKAVEAANARMMQPSRAAGDRAAPSSGIYVRSTPPSRDAIAQAGQRALQSFKK